MISPELQSGVRCCVGYFLMIFATLIWGAGFVGTRWTFIDYTPAWSNAMRFIVAAVLVSPYLLYTVRQLKARVIAVSAFLMYLGLHFQTLGIAQTSLAKSGFLTVFYALFTPILVVLFLKQKIRPIFWVLVFVAMFGVAMLCELDIDQFNRGDAYVLLSAFFFATHILWIDVYAQRVNAVNFNFWQCFFVAIYASAWALYSEGRVSFEPLLRFEDLGRVSSISGFLILSVFSSLLAFTIQVVAQKQLPAHVVSLIFLLECVFAALFGYLFFAESLSPMAISGAVLVLLSVALVPRFCKMAHES